MWWDVRIDGDLDDALAEALSEGYIAEQAGEYIATAQVLSLVPGTSRT